MSKKGLEETPLNNENKYDYDALFNEGERRGKFAQTTAIGEFRNPRKFACVDWAFLVVSIVSLLVVLALNIERFITFERTFNLTQLNNSSSPLQCERWYCTSDFVFTLSVTLNLVFCAFYCLDALFRERAFELLAFIGAAWVIAIYVIGNLIYNDVEQNLLPSTIKIVRLAFVCVFVPLMSVLALVVYRNMGFLLLNVIGSNKKLTRAFHIRSFFETLQYFHIEIMANLIVLAFAMDGRFITLVEKILLFVLLVLLICVSLWGYISVMWEFKLASIAWYILMLPFLTYYIYKIVQVSIGWHNYRDSYLIDYIDDQEVRIDFSTVGVALLIANVLGILAIVILVVSMTISITNFGLGLKDKSMPPFSRCVHHIVK